MKTTHLEFGLVSEWPRLAWAARIHKSDGQATVFHGDGVEIADHWCCEAVWAGDFGAGDFDRTDLVAGSGVRLRDGRLNFVSAGSTIDRLNWLDTGERIWVSNSLACLLTVLDADIDPTYPGYFADLNSIVAGLDRYRRSLQTSAGPVQLTYFDNLAWTGDGLERCEKPGRDRDFSTFSAYRNFLQASLLAVSHNAMSSLRRHPYSLLGTLSTGYDSTMVTALAKDVGCRDVICVDRARGGDDDSGIAVAAELGVTPHLVGRNAWKRMALAEAPFVAADAKGEDVFFRGAEPLLMGRVLLTGFHGDKMWSKTPHDVSENIVRGDCSGLSLTEYRLRAGFLHCPIPFWGVRQIRDVTRISNSSEMSRWEVAGDYSRPICRRIVEEAGVPREMFGVKKKAASVIFNTADRFMSPQSNDDYLAWLKRNRCEWIRRARVPPVANLKLDRWEQSGRQYMASKLKDAPGLWRVSSWLNRPTRLRRHVFPWALEHVRATYRGGVAVD